jgi:hypothetical protein
MSDTTTADVAHVVHPGSKMHDVLLGNKTKAKALCGVWVTKAPPSDGPVCRGCFDALMRLDLEASTKAQTAS